MQEARTTDTKTALAVVPEALTVDCVDGAALIGVSRATFWKLNSSGRLPMPLRFGRVVRWRKRELADWLNAGCPNRDVWKWKTTA